jgi:hypothetical protein
MLVAAATGLPGVVMDTSRCGAHHRHPIPALLGAEEMIDRERARVRRQAQRAGRSVRFRHRAVTRKGASRYVSSERSQAGALRGVTVLNGVTGLSGVTGWGGQGDRAAGDGASSFGQCG